MIMDDYVVKVDEAIDPEVRAFVFSLISALGGSSAADDGKYVLGDDALAVLKDIKRWLRLYDDKTNRLDVARLLAEGNLVVGDLLEILASWPEDAGDGTFRSKISLLCVDLLTQLTWPIEKDEENTRLDHFYHIPYIRTAQVKYKQAVLHHTSIPILRTVIRVALPALAKSRKDRSLWEDNIIKVVLYFFRNIAMISPSSSQSTSDYSAEIEGEVCRSTTVNAFHDQDIFHLILMICSSMADDYTTHDVEILDILFHLLKGVDVERLMMNQDEASSANTKDLHDLIRKEKAMISSYSRYAPSRHNRWSNITWVKREEGKFSTIFGQKPGTDEQSSMNAIDQSKKWKPPRRPKKNIQDNGQLNFDRSVPLTAKARKHLSKFVEQFLDSSFNALFNAVRRAIEREVDRVLETHLQQYFYLISWFLRAETARRVREQAKRKVSGASSEAESYGLVASVLNQETFVLLARSMQKAADQKNWSDLKAQMRCFTQILLTVQDMSESPLEEDEEIAENILSRIFYEQSTHDRIIGLIKAYNDQGFGYLDACTELSHVFLRLLERYSKQNADMQIRSIRRARKKQIQPQSESQTGSNEDSRQVEAGDIEEAQRVSSERKFDFTKFVAKFITQSSVDTFLALLRYYKDLTDEQLKRAHRFFYRVAFKMEMSMYLFRMDIILFFHRFIKGPGGLDARSSCFQEWQELVQQVFRRLVKRLEDRPALAVELLFTKMSTSMFYLEHGFDREVPKKAQRVQAELEVKPGMSLADEIGVAVSVLINASKFDALSWIKKILLSALEERKAWEDLEEAREISQSNSLETPSNNQTDANAENEISKDAEGSDQKAKKNMGAPTVDIKVDDGELGVLKDKHVRLLLAVIGANHSEDQAVDMSNTSLEKWYFPSSVDSTALKSALDLIEKYEFNPPIYEDGAKRAEDYIRRKARVDLTTSGGVTGSKRRSNDVESEGGSDLSDLEQLFPVGGPSVRESSRSPERNKTRRKRNKHTAEDLDEQELEERRKLRKEREREKLRKIKSELYVRESDDETDEERDRSFFEQEEKLRQTVRQAMKEANANEPQGIEKSTDNTINSVTRKKRILSDDESDSSRYSISSARKRKKKNSSADSDMDGSAQVSRRRGGSKRRGFRNSTDNSEADTDAETDASMTTPASSQDPQLGDQGTRGNMASDRIFSNETDDEDSDKENAGQSNSKKTAKSVEPVEPVEPTLRRRAVRAGFIIDSDSDDDND